MRAIPIICIILVLLSSCSKEKATSPKLVKTTAGWIKGTSNADSSVYVYKGVPFAAPPVGELRWKEPQPIKTWSDTLKCTEFGASPIQSKPVPFMMWTKEFITPPEPLSEDCLFLNVWSPAHKAGDKLPVLVWIHGGGFVSGSGACAVYDGEALAKQGIVFVSINYRQGIFGFFAHPDLTAESSHKASGNYALLDQVAALEWVQGNIGFFGGDPTQVTIDGQSAGSIAVEALITSPLAKGLLSKAIAQSGAFGARPLNDLKEAEKTGTGLAQKVKAANIGDLRALPADSVFKLGQTLPWGTFSPIVDGYFLPEQPASIIDKHLQNDVPLMAGWVTGDAGLVTQNAKTKAEFVDYVSKTYPSRKEAFLELFPANDELTSVESQKKLGLLSFAGVPNYLLALSNKSNTYLYEYRYVPTDKPDFPNYGAFHTSDVPFALHTLDHWDRPWKQTDRDVEKYMSSYWINFIKTGNPNGTGLTEWPSYDKTSGNVMVMNETPAVSDGLFKKELEFLSAK